ncbi:hypothetical protein M513_09817 [Trichuris suis]|uniref:Uncharacterized protein n=1 Tax=Trichuris suis TaxID=68888 RepID=A0A085LWB9_9BILA|nr:hypothetical protein M513_09817 [Trichuris suis]
MMSEERRKKKGTGNGKDNGITPNTGKLKGREKKHKLFFRRRRSIVRAVNQPRSIGRGQSAAANGPAPVEDMEGEVSGSAAILGNTS